jgi:hypothetical protein
LASTKDRRKDQTAIERVEPIPGGIRRVLREARGTVTVTGKRPDGTPVEVVLQDVIFRIGEDEYQLDANTLRNEAAVSGTAVAEHDAAIGGRFSSADSVRRYRHKGAEDLLHLRTAAESRGVLTELHALLDGETPPTAVPALARLAPLPNLRPNKPVPSSQRHKRRSDAARKLVAAVMQGVGFGEYERIKAVKYIAAGLRQSAIETIEP